MRVERPIVEETPGPINFSNFLNRILTLKKQGATVPLPLPKSIDIRGDIERGLQRVGKHPAQHSGHLAYAEGRLAVHPFGVSSLVVAYRDISDAPLFELVNSVKMQQKLLERAIGRITANPGEFGAGTFIAVEQNTTFVLEVMQPTRGDLMTGTFFAKLNFISQALEAIRRDEEPGVWLAGFADAYLRGLSRARPFIVYREEFKEGRPTGILHR